MKPAGAAARQRVGWRACAGLVIVCAALPAAAHGPLRESLAQHDRRIAEQPRNPHLWIERAELQRMRRDFAAALRDLDRAERLLRADPNIALLRARVHLDAGHPAKALDAAARSIAREPRQPQAWFVRAQALASLGRHAAAAESYASGHALLDRPAPDTVLAQARAWRTAGAGHHLQAALNALDVAMAQLGPIVALQSEAIALEVALGNVDAALARLSTLSAHADRKETWLARRGDILRAAGRDDEALAAYREASQRLEALPSSLRNTPAMLSLRGSLQGHLSAMADRPRNGFDMTTPRKGQQP